MVMKHGIKRTLEGAGFSFGYFEEAGFGAALSGTADRPYAISDFLIAKEQNLINNPIGIGIFLSILTLIAIILLLLRFKELTKSENHWLAITLVWLAFTLYAVNASKFAIKLSPFRAWMLLAIPVCILAAHGAFNLMGIAKKSMGNAGKYTVLIILLIGIFFTSTQQKIAVNTATWPPGGFWTSGEEIAAYIWIKDNLPKNSRMFTFTNSGPIIGMDMYECRWCDDVRDYQKNGFNKSADDNHNWLKSRSYSYIIIDGQTAQKFGANETNNKLRDLGQSGLFQPIFQNQGAVVLKV